MKRLKNNQQGFSAWLLLLLLLVIIFLFLIFWFVRQQETKKKQSNSTPASNSQSASPQQNTQQPAASNNQATAPYLEIKEYGVKVPLTTAILDAYYTAKDVKTSAIDLRVKSLDGESDCKNGDGSLASIIKVNKDETSEMLDGKKYSEAMPGVLVGNNFFYLGLAQYYCSDTQQAKIDQIRSALSQAAKKLEKL